MSSSTIPRRLNKAAAAEALGISVPALDGWVRRGCPVIKRGGLGSPWVFDLLEVLRWRYERPDLPPPTDPEHMTPQERKAWYQSEAIRRALEDRDAELIPAEDVTQTVNTFCRVITERMSALPDAMRAAGIDDEAVLLALRHNLEPIVANFKHSLSDLVPIDEHEPERLSTLTKE